MSRDFDPTQGAHIPLYLWLEATGQALRYASQNLLQPVLLGCSQGIGVLVLVQGH
jgi:hypothetical protein